MAAVALHAGAGAVCFVVGWKESSRPTSPTRTVNINLRIGSAPAVRQVDSESLETEPSVHKERSRSDSIAAHPRASDDSAEVGCRPPSEPPEDRADAGAAEESVAAAPVHTPEPPYPPLARRRGWSGRGVIEFKIAVDGACCDVRIVESTGHQILDDAMVDAVSRWRFQPERVGDQAVVAVVRRPFRFRLGDR